MDDSLPEPQEIPKVSDIIIEPKTHADHIAQAQAL